MELKAPQFNLREKLKEVPAEQMQSLWGILFVVMTLVTLFWSFPQWNSYRQVTQEIQILSQDILDLENQTALEENNKRQVEAQRLEQGQEIIARENKILPESIDISSIAGTLEIMALQLESLDLDREAYFELTSLNFARSKDDTDKTQSVQMNFSTDLKNLTLFIDYLQNGTIPSILYQGVQDKFISPTILTSLEQNPLPLSTINTLQVTENSKDQTLKVNLHLTFYTQ